MKRKIKLLFLVLQTVLGLRQALAQTETQPVQTSNKYGVVEEYSVLKSDKTVRQGAYVRYHPAGPLSGLAVYEAGTYERGLKEGEWRCFAEQYPWNKLLSKGTYRAGLPEGMWLYYYPSLIPKKTAPARNSAGASLSVELDDTTSTVQAKGLCYKGARVGVWKYYSPTGQLIQAINHSAGQLLYWQPAASQPTSGDALAANHPLLYVGGKARLQMDIVNCLDLKSLLNLKQEGSAVFHFLVDSTSHQTRIMLPENMLPNPYETLVLTALKKVSTQWLAQVVQGRPVAAEYRVRISTTRKDLGLRANVEPLGE